MKILIITGGHIDYTFGMKYLKEHKFDKVIAVDGGLAFADYVYNSSLNESTHSFRLTDIVGDFDTIEYEIIKRYKSMKDGPVIHEYIPEKDNTDTDIALRLAVEMCKNSDLKDTASEITLLGATGTRLDHVLANITMLLMPFEAGINAYMVDTNNRIQLFNGTKIVRKQAQFGKYVSLIPLTSTLKGIILEGFKYPLQNHEIALGSSLCVSNEITADEAVITVEEGIAILLETRD